MSKVMTDVHVDSLNWTATRAAAGFTMDGARYHLWFNIETMKHEGILYKNPPLDTKSRDPGYFDTRRLDADNAANRPLVVKLFAEIKERKLIEAAIQAEKGKQAEAQRQQEAQHLLYLKKDAGPDLYAALKGLLEAAKTERYMLSDEDPRMVGAYAAIKKAEEGVA